MGQPWLLFFFFGFVSLRVCVYLSTHTRSLSIRGPRTNENQQLFLIVPPLLSSSMDHSRVLRRTGPSSVIDGSYHLANSVIAGFSALTWTTLSKLTTERVDPRCNDLAHSSRRILRIRDSDKSLSLTWRGEDGRNCAIRTDVHLRFRTRSKRDISCVTIPPSSPSSSRENDQSDTKRSEFSIGFPRANSVVFCDIDFPSSLLADDSY